MGGTFRFPSLLPPESAPQNPSQFLSEERIVLTEGTSAGWRTSSQTAKNATSRCRILLHMSDWLLHNAFAREVSVQS